VPVPIHCSPLLNCCHEPGNELVEEDKCLTVKSTFPISPDIPLIIKAQSDTSHYITSGTYFKSSLKTMAE
jgi:hypothetical protein